MVPKPHNMWYTIHRECSHIAPKIVGTQPDGVHTWSHEEIVHSQDCKWPPHTKPCCNRVAVDKKLGCTKLINLYHYSWVYTPSLLSARTLEEDQNLMMITRHSYENHHLMYRPFDGDGTFCLWRKLHASRITRCNISNIQQRHTSLVTWITK